MRRGIGTKLRRGEWPGKKPLGYIYDRDKRNIVPHPKEAKIVKLMFEEFATSRQGLLGIADHLAEFSVTNVSGRPWSRSQVHSFLTNRLYLGIMVWKEEAFKGKYKPIISPDLFAKVQKTLKDRSKPRRVRNGHDFPFCGLFRCTCGSMVSAQWTHGNGGTYRYYRCSRKTGRCYEPYTQEHFVTEQCLNQLKSLVLTPEQATAIRVLMDGQIEKDCESIEATATDLEENLASVQEKLNKLTRGYLDAVIDQESYESAKADLVLEKTTLKTRNEQLRRAGSRSWNEPAKEVINGLEMAGKLQNGGSLKEIGQLVRKVGTNRLITHKKVSFDFSEPYQFAASLLGNFNRDISENPSLVNNVNWWSTKWCA